MVIDLAMQIKDEIKHLITNNAELQDRVDELTAEREQYRDNMLAQTRIVAELTAERDKLQKHKRRATMKVMRLEQEREQLDRRMAELAGKYQERLQQIAKLTAEHDELQAAIDAMENGQFYAMYEELRAEVDNLRKRNDNQADTIKRLRAEFDVALDDLARAVEDKRSHPF